MILIKTIKPTFLLPSLKYTYISPLDKPVISIPINSIIETSVEFMQYFNIQGSMCSQLSVLGGAFFFRIGIQVFSVMFRSLKHKQKIKEPPLPKINEQMTINNRKRFMTRWIDKIFVIDAIRDYRFNEIDEKTMRNDIKQYYRPAYFLGSLSTSYFLLNFFRGANRIVTQPAFLEFSKQTAYLPSLASYDPNFITPIIPIVLTYYLLRGSQHPFFINMRRPQNKFHCLNLAFMVGLIMVPIPGIYHFGYMGMIIGHCFIRYGRKLMKPIKRIWKKEK